jgi:AmpD protein
VSSHALIRRDGELVQYVPFQHRAWHAGASTYCGRERCNDFSIGIELEGSDEEAYEPIQYRILMELIAALCKAYPTLSSSRVVGHSDVAPGRKTDPGPAFDWVRLRAIRVRRVASHRRLRVGTERARDSNGAHGESCAASDRASLRSWRW